MFLNKTACSPAVRQVEWLEKFKPHSFSDAERISAYEGVMLVVKAH